MQRVKANDYVTVTYEGHLNNGEMFESSRETGPLCFQIGDNSIFPGFENAVIGMAVNETKTITLQPEEAHGPRQEDLILTLNQENFGDLNIQKGLVVTLTVEKDGTHHKVPALIAEINADNTVTVDFNHPLAGQELTYTITVQSIDQKPQPAASGCDCTSTTDNSCSPAGACSGCN